MSASGPTNKAWVGLSRKTIARLKAGLTLVEPVFFQNRGSAQHPQHDHGANPKPGRIVSVV